MTVSPIPAGPGPQVVILTGVSGSGKTTALRALEDAGFYCVDNLPIVFLDKLLELSGHTAGEISRIALVVDAREPRFLADAPRAIQEVRRKGNDVRVLFFDASDDSLVRRYSPLAASGILAVGAAFLGYLLWSVQKLRRRPPVIAQARDEREERLRSRRRRAGPDSTIQAQEATDMEGPPLAREHRRGTGFSELPALLPGVHGMPPSGTARAPVPDSRGISSWRRRAVQTKESPSSFSMS